MLTYRWIPIGATVILVAVFAVVAMVFSLRWRGDLRDGVLRREAEALDAILRLKQRPAPGLAQLATYGIGDGSDDFFTAVIESAALRGVIQVRWFDAGGNLRHA